MLTQENMLPIGTVVKLKESSANKYIITGYALKADGKRYDYCAVLYPFGELNSMGADRVFDVDDIAETVFEGFRGENPTLFDLLTQLVTAKLQEQSKEATETDDIADLT